jgi:hypothetical protein
MIRQRYNVTADSFDDSTLEEPSLFLELPHVLW